MLTNARRLPLRNTTENQEDVMVVTYAGPVRNLSKNEQPANAMLIEVINLLCYTCEADYSDFKKVQEAGAGQCFMELVAILLLDKSYSMTHQSALENTSNNVFGQFYKEDPATW